MKAAIFERPGLEYLTIKQDVEQPAVTDHDVLIKVKAAGVNPLDYTVFNAKGINPLPHIPGAEIAGKITKVGKHQRL